MAVADLQVLAAALASHGEVGTLDQAFVLLTVDSEGFPFACLLSSRQIAVRTEQLVALVDSRRTTANLAGDGRATLHVIYGGASLLARLQISSIQKLKTTNLFFFEVLVIESDRRSTILTPIMYQLNQEILDQEGPSVNEIMKSVD